MVPPTSLLGHGCQSQTTPETKPVNPLLSD